MENLDQNSCIHVGTKSVTSGTSKCPASNAIPTTTKPSKSLSFLAPVVLVDGMIFGARNVALIEQKGEANQKDLADLKNIPHWKLVKRYKSEYQSWRNMHQRVRAGIREACDEFRSFRLFLMYLGPKPNPSYTLDRINNDDLEYKPGNVRWATRTMQNQNKGDSIAVRSTSKAGRVYLAKALDSKHGLQPGTTRKRRSRGWTDAELIAGHRSKVKSISHETNALEIAWLQAMSVYHPTLIVLRTSKARGLLAHIEAVLSEFQTGIAAEVLRAVVQHWDAFRSLIHEATGLEETRMPQYPNLPFIVSNLDCAVRLWTEVHGLVVANGKLVPQPLKSTAPFNITEDDL